MAAFPTVPTDPPPASGLRALSYGVGDIAVIVVEGRLDGTGMLALGRT